MIKSGVTRLKKRVRIEGFENDDTEISKPVQVPAKPVICKPLADAAAVNATVQGTATRGAGAFKIKRSSFDLSRPLLLKASDKAAPEPVAPPPSDSNVDTQQELVEDKVHATTERKENTDAIQSPKEEKNVVILPSIEHKQPEPVRVLPQVEEKPVVDSTAGITAAKVEEDASTTSTTAAISPEPNKVNAISPALPAALVLAPIVVKDDDPFRRSIPITKRRGSVSDELSSSARFARISPPTSPTSASMAQTLQTPESPKSKLRRSSLMYGGEKNRSFTGRHALDASASLEEKLRLAMTIAKEKGQGFHLMFGSLQNLEGATGGGMGCKITSAGFLEWLQQLGMSTDDKEVAVLMKIISGSKESDCISLQQLIKWCLTIPSVAWKAEKKRRMEKLGAEIPDLDAIAQSIVDELKPHPPPGPSPTTTLTEIGGRKIIQGSPTEKGPHPLGEQIFSGSQLQWRSNENIVKIYFNKDFSALIVCMMDGSRGIYFPAIVLNSTQIPQNLEVQKFGPDVPSGTDESIASDRRSSSTAIKDDEPSLSGDHALKAYYVGVILVRLRLPGASPAGERENKKSENVLTAAAIETVPEPVPDTVQDVRNSRETSLEQKRGRSLSWIAARKRSQELVKKAAAAASQIAANVSGKAENPSVKAENSSAKTEKTGSVVSPRPPSDVQQHEMKDSTARSNKQLSSSSVSGSAPAVPEKRLSALGNERLPSNASKTTSPSPKGSPSSAGSVAFTLDPSRVPHMKRLAGDTDMYETLIHDTLRGEDFDLSPAFTRDTAPVSLEVFAKLKDEVHNSLARSHRLSVSAISHIEAAEHSIRNL